MATDEIFKIVMQVAGEDKVHALHASITQEEAGLRSLIQALQASGNAHFAQDAGVRAHAATLQHLTKELKTAEKAAKSMGGMGRSSAQNLMQIGHTLDDLQYVGTLGLQPILNNLMFMNAQLGIAALLGYQLYAHWDQLAKLWGDDTGAQKAMRSVKGLTDHIEKLKAAVASGAATTVDILDLDVAEKNLAAMTKTEAKVKEMKAHVDPETAARGGAVEAAVNEAGGLDAVAEVYAGPIRKENERLMATASAEERDAYQFNKDIISGKEKGFEVGGEFGGFVEYTDEDRKRAAAKIKDMEARLGLKAEGTMGKTIGAAATGDLAELKKLRQFAIDNPEMFGKSVAGQKKHAKFLADLERAEGGVSPEQQRADESQGRDNARAYEKAQKARNEATQIRQAQHEAHRLERDQKKRDEIEEKAAKQIEGGETGEKLLRGTLTAKEVERRMVELGVKPEVAGANAQGALDQARKDTKEQIAARAGERGISLDVARDQLIEEHQQAERDRRIKDAEKKMPGVAGAVTGQLRGATGQAGTDPRAQMALMRQLMGSGLDQDAATALVTEGTKDARADFLKDTLQRPRRNSQTIDSLSYAQTIQAGVGGAGTAEKSLTELQGINLKFVQFLNLAQRGGLAGPARFGP